MTLRQLKAKTDYLVHEGFVDKAEIKVSDTDAQGELDAHVDLYVEAQRPVEHINVTFSLKRDSIEEVSKEETRE